MTISKDRRPRDWGYIIHFSPDDWPMLQYMAQTIRETHDTDIIERLHSACEQGSNSDLILDNGKGLKILSAVKSDDIVLNQGLDQCIKLIQGTSAIKWAYMGWTGSILGASPVTPNDALIQDGDLATPIPLATNGWSEARGMKMFFGTITQQVVNAPENPEDTTHDTQNQIAEIGIYNKVPPSTGALLNREQFKNNILIRSTSTDGLMYRCPFILSCVIEFCPVA